MVCLPWDAGTALEWAALLAELRGKGLALALKDSMIAASAARHKLAVATRNVEGFEKAGVPVVNPFS
jgi:predicted nucleic acid-binding protein